MSVTSDSLPGLRVQIILSLAGLMTLAFVPLLFAIASLTDVTLRASREENARALVHAISVDIFEAKDESERVRLIKRHAGHHGIRSLSFFDTQGRREISASTESESNTLRETARGRGFDLSMSGESGTLIANVRNDEDTARASPLVQLVALYTISFALALLTFAYFAITRLIVRPIDDLAHAANKVAHGARQLTLPRAGARELVDLGTSMQEMTARLVADESAMRDKVSELTEPHKRLTETQTQLVRSERMAVVGHLAAGIAHEIGNPITALIGLNDFLLDSLKGGVDDMESTEVFDFLKRMRREAERIHIVIRDLLDFARAESVHGADENGSTKSSLADLHEVIEDVLALLRPQRIFKGIQIQTELDESPLRVKIAPGRLTQVLLNLLLNAGNAIARQGPPSSIIEGCVTVRAKRDLQTVRIEIEDSGPGIPSELYDKIFEPFFTTSEVGQGTGLGLAVCRSLVESVNGSIFVDPEYTQGARFVIVLPSTRE